MNDAAHWQAVYQARAADAVSWYQASASRSLALIQRLVPSLDFPIVDVGGGASVLVDELLAAGYHELTVLDISGAALSRARQRLGELAGAVHWMEADATTADLPEGRFALWHDRAAFHFLTEPGDRAA